ncbi:MAG: 50S ribosomal protein L6 [Candidatus Omnitrophica bacterium]|nr:50S ribosomal protein L6 [Candidatus Omnitrophota bacterium]
MSRIGRKPIKLPKQTKIAITGQHIIVEGPKGKLEYDAPSEITVTQNNDVIAVERKSDLKRAKAFHGLVRALIQNMITGVTQGFMKELEIVGVGFRAQTQAKMLNLQLGFSHPIHYAIPVGIAIETPSPNSIIIKGIDRQRVGQVAAEIREFYPPEPYKGKGVRYKDERVKRKVGKKVA